jgi:replicative DNA helicase
MEQQMTEKIELTILRNLLCNEEYYRKVVPFVKPDYFQDHHEKVIYEEVWNFASNYKMMPTAEILTINLQGRKDIDEETYQNSIKTIKELHDGEVEPNWLLDTTEKWCKDRAIYLALLESIKIADGGNQKVSPDAIPAILQEALAVSFDEHVGHDYVDNAEQRYDYYHLKEDKIPFDLEKFNLITKGGIPNKTLNIALAGTGVGKSLFMCHCAASALSQGRNVLYITLEMAEEKIAERIDANLLNVNIKDIGSIPESIFTSRVKEIGRKTQGRLIIKEYPTASAHSGHFKSLLSELSLKKSFKPDLIFIDYLNICASSRYKGHIVNSYTYVKAIAEELRGLAVEHNVPIMSATQTTRSGYGNSDVDLTDTSESFGLPATADFMFALISTEELESSGRIMVKQLKNRYNDPTFYKRFTVGVDRAKMKLYNVEDSESSISSDDEEETYESFEDNSSRQKRLDKFSNFIL